MSEMNAQSEDIEFRLGLLNDSWGGGSTPVYDDLRTGGVQLSYLEENQFQIDARFSFLTNRFADDPNQRIGLDETRLAISVPIYRLTQAKGLLWFKFGFLTNGSRLGAKVQRFIHDKLNVVQADVMYSNGKKINFLLGYLFTKNIMTRNLSNGKKLDLNFENSLDYIHTYSSSIGFKFPFSLTANNNSRITFSLNYTINKSPLYDHNLLVNLTTAESGFNYTLGFFGRKLFYKFNIFPKEGFSSGSVGVRLSNKKSINKSQYLLKVETSVLTSSYGYNVKYSFFPRIKFNRKTSIIINHNFRTLLKGSIPSSPRINGHATQITLGTEVELLRYQHKPRWINPYMNLSLGKSVIGIYSKVEDIQLAKSFHFTVNSDIGTVFSIPSGFKKKFSRLKFSIYQRFIYMAPLTPENESLLVNKNRNPYATFHKTFGVGVIFGI